MLIYFQEWIQFLHRSNVFDLSKQHPLEGQSMAEMRKQYDRELGFQVESFSTTMKIAARQRKLPTNYRTKSNFQQEKNCIHYEGGEIDEPCEEMGKGENARREEQF